MATSSFMFRRWHYLTAAAITATLVVGLAVNVAHRATADDDIQTAKAKPATPEKEVTAALNDAVRRIKTKDYEGFIKYYLPVDVIRRLRDQEQMDATIASMQDNAEGSARFIKLLESMRNEKPTFNATKTEATFRVTPKEDGKPPVPDTPAEPKTTNVKLAGFGSDRNAAIGKAVAALEAGKVGSFIDGMFPAGELRRPDAEKRRKQILSRMKPGSAAVKQMIADLKKLRTLKPTLEEAGSVAVYEIPGRSIEVGRKTIKLPDRKFKLQKVENSWRLYDRTTAARKEIARQARLSPPKHTPQGGTYVKFEKIGDVWRIQEINN